MEPDNKNFELAPELPQPEEAGTSKYGAEFKPAAAPETQLGPQPGHPAAPIQSSAPATDNVSAGATQQAQPVSTPAIQMSQDLIADDSDLIEKEWVMKAKAIVAYTQDDPHRQNEEMTKVKADYLKKRYNKDLKMSEG